MKIYLEKHDSIMIEARNGFVKMFVDDDEDLQIYHSANAKVISEDKLKVDGK